MRIAFVLFMRFNETRTEKNKLNVAVWAKINLRRSRALCEIQTGFILLPHALYDTV